MRVLSIPNAVTCLRIVIIPGFVTAMIYDRRGLALMLFLLAGATDAVDGFLARLTGQQTEFGALLDPLADKLLLVTSLVLFSVNGWAPKWLAITVLSRDFIVVAGWMLLYLIYGVRKIEPTLTGKTAAAGQVVLIAYILLEMNFAAIPPISGAIGGAVAALTIISGFQYILRGLKHAAEK